MESRGSAVTSSVVYDRKLSSYMPLVIGRILLGWESTLHCALMRAEQPLVMYKPHC